MNIPKPFASAQNQKALLVSMESLERSVKEMSAYTQSLYRIQQLGDKDVQYRIANKALQAVKGTIRGYLGVNYTASGVAKNTGALYRATVSGAVISFNAKLNGAEGIFIHMAPGFRDDVYAAASVFRYGAVYGGREATKDAASRLGVDSVLGKGGEKQRRRVKKAAEKAYALGQTKFGGASYVPPKTPFFTLTTSQRGAVIQMYQTEFVAITNQWIAAQMKAARNGK